MMPRRMRALLVVLVCLAVVAASWLALDATPAPPAITAVAAPSEPVRATAADAVDRTMVAGAEAAALEPAFVSEFDDDEPVANAVRNGVVVELLDELLVPMPGAKLTVEWHRRGDDWLRGTDRGTTDAAGRLATTVQSVGHLVSVTLHDPERGNPSSADSRFVAAAGDPRTVRVAIPRRTSVRVRLATADGRPVPGGTVTVSSAPDQPDPRVALLVGDDTRTTSDVHGELRLALPPGEHRLAGAAPGYAPLYRLDLTVGATERAVLLLLADESLRREVTVRVDAPPGVRFVRLQAVTTTVPACAHGGDAIVPEQREFHVRNPVAGRFHVAAEPSPFRVTVVAPGCHAASAEIAADQLEARVALQRAPAPAPETTPAPAPKARLRCRVRRPDGEDRVGAVIVHTAPPPAGGTTHPTELDGSVVIELTAGQRVCLRGWSPDCAPGVVGPLDVTAGEHDVTIELPPASTVRGRVVDENGAPIAADVQLLRPPGPIEQLAAAAPNFLPKRVADDVLGTGSSGEFSFGELGPGEHEILATPHGPHWPVRRRFVAGESDLVLRAGEGNEHLALVSGTVRVRPGPLPFRGGVVHCIQQRFALRRQVDAEGRFTLAVPPGVHDVLVTAPDHTVVAARGRHLPAGPSTIALELEPAEALFVRVSDAHGRGVPGVRVLADAATGGTLVLHDWFEGGEPLTNRQCRAALRGLPDVALRLRLELDGRRHDVDCPAGVSRAGDFVVVWPGGG